MNTLTTSRSRHARRYPSLNVALYAVVALLCITFPKVVGVTYGAPADGVTRGADGRVSATPLTDRVLLIQFQDESGGAARIDTERAAQTATYLLRSPDDPAYKQGTAPIRVGRKSKGQNFRNEAGKTVWQTIHWLYLELPQPLQPGNQYVLSWNGTGVGTQPVPFTFDPARSRSEAIHINTVGYTPSAPEKFAYVSHWMGDIGPLALDGYAKGRFHLRDAATRRVVFSGPLTLRLRRTEPEGGQQNECPNNNYTGADVWQCDFSAFRTPGAYVLSVDGIGCSYPFSIDRDVYRAAFRTVARALFHQRCGTALESRYTDHPRAACHLPTMRPFLTTTDRYLDAPHSDGDPKADSKTTGEKRTVSGGWHDAGDWDRENGHLSAAATLLLAYELAPENFSDGELNIPESGNGIPDIVDEVRWCVDYYRRLQRTDGSVSVGFYESSFPLHSEYSVTDSLKWYVYAEDPQATYRYAMAASHLALCLRIAGKPAEAAPYIASARSAWEWAGKNLRPGDEAKIRDDRFNAAAALYSATGKAVYQEALKKDCVIETPETPLFEWNKRDQQIGVWTYLLARQPDRDAALATRLLAATRHYAEVDFVGTAARRSGRYGYNWYVPMWWGAATEPRTLPLMVAHRLTGDARYLARQQTTCDFMLGGNPLNMTWVTGLGARHPREVHHLDSWQSGKAEPVPGIIPLGPYRSVSDPVHGPWEVQFAQQTCYPVAKLWPPHELWFENRLCPPTNEFTVGSLANAAAAYGYLCAPREKPIKTGPPE